MAKRHGDLVTFSITVPEEAKQELDKIAKQYQMNRTDVVRLILLDFLNSGQELRDLMGR